MASISNNSHFNELPINVLTESNNVSPSAEPRVGQFVSKTGEIHTIEDVTEMKCPDNQAARTDRVTLANQRWLEKYPEAGATYRPFERMQPVPVAVNASEASLLATEGGIADFNIGHGAEEKTLLSPKEIIASTLNGVRNLETKLQGYNDDISSLIESAKSDAADPHSSLAQLPFYQSLTPEEERASIEDINNKKQQVADEVIPLLSKSINGLQENLDQVLGQLNRTNLSASEKSELQNQKQICEKGLVELRGKLENVKKLLASSSADMNYSIERFQSKLTSARTAVAGLAESLSQTGKDMAALQAIILLQQQQMPQQPDLNSNKNEVLVGSAPTDATAGRSVDSMKTAEEQTKADDDNLNKEEVQSEKAADKKEATKQEQKALSEQKAALLAAEGLSVSNAAVAVA